MSTIIKICGLRTEKDVDCINAVKPDYAGVVLCSRLGRSIDREEAKRLRRRLDPNIPLVGLFVNDPFCDVLVALRQGIVDMVQLQGTESEEYITSLQMMSRKPVIKACRVHDASVLPYAESSAADYILLESKAEGQRYDSALIQQVKRPYFLSGGLEPENLEMAIQELHPWGVNLLEGVETDGHLDERKVAAAVEIARG